MAATAHPTQYRQLPRHGSRHVPHNRPVRPHLRVIPGGRTDAMPPVPAPAVPAGRTRRDVRTVERRRASRVERRRALRIAVIGAVCWLVLLGAGLVGASRGDVGAPAPDAVSRSVDAGR